MLKKRIIPCLDVKDGRVVKGINFIDLVDAGDPVEQAKFYSENGADEVCFLDISASLEERDTMLDVLKKTAEEVFIPLTVGGGLRDIEDIKGLKKIYTPQLEGVIAGKAIYVGSIDLKEADKLLDAYA